MKGGARTHSGPPPDPAALKRDRDGGSWVTLSSEGRVGEPPEWPLTDASGRELELWTREWRRPQALMWEPAGLEVEVALYVRCLVQAEQADARVNLRTLVKQQQEALGLSLPGLARNRWRIAAPEGDREPSRRAPGRSSKQRFEVVTGGRAG